MSYTPAPNEIIRSPGLTSGLPPAQVAFARCEINNCMPGATMGLRVTALDANGSSLSSTPVTLDISQNAALAALIPQLLAAAAQAAGI